MNLIEKLRQFLTPVHPLPSGMFHYQAPPDSPRPYRLHLRLETDGQGVLIVNASTVLHLNQTAAEYAYHLIKQTPDEDVAKSMVKRYRVRKEQALNDYHDLADRLNTLIETPDLDPENFLGIERHELYDTQLSAPYRLDCALTYKVPDSTAHPLAPVDRVKRELLTEEWKTILEKAWQAGIPHIVFTGGEPTLRPDLPELIAHAEQLGQVTGLLTDGLRLTEPKYLHQLLQEGLDHAMFLLNPSDEQSWEALRDLLAEDIHTTVHLTITQAITPSLPKLLDRISQMGATHLSLSAETPALKDELKAASQAAAERFLTLVSDLPVPYSRFNPVTIEEEEEAPSDGSGKAWLYVEPDGDVLPAQGTYESLGNLLNDSWEKIWQKK